MSSRFQRHLERRELLRQQAIAIIGFDPSEPPLEPPRIPPSERDPRSPRHLAVQLLRERDGTNCYLCRTPLDVDQCFIEHIIPISQGGENEPHNTAISCGTCNNTKAGRYVSLSPSGSSMYHRPR